MQPIDFSRLVDTPGVENFSLRGVAPAEEIYRGCGGIQFRSQDKDSGFIEDRVRLAESAFLFSSDYASGGGRGHRQVVNDSDWVHIQFRLNGGGRETVSQSAVIETPEKSCIVARYPKSSLIERTVDSAGSWRVACLLVSPAGLADLLDTPASRLPESVAWMALEGERELRSCSLPLQSAMTLAVNDILACSFRGSTRRAYMRAKSIELLATVIHALSSAQPEAGRPVVKLSSADLERLSLARELMSGELESPMTLAQLARRVGLNRTKLALGFKEVYGTSVQAYWRDARLSRARELLRDSEARVTEVALSMGYSELSSFTRAFIRKFGVLPRDCKGGTGPNGTYLTRHPGPHSIRAGVQFRKIL